MSRVLLKIGLSVALVSALAGCSGNSIVATATPDRAPVKDVVTAPVSVSPEVHPPAGYFYPADLCARLVVKDQVAQLNCNDGTVVILGKLSLSIDSVMTHRVANFDSLHPVQSWRLNEKGNLELTYGPTYDEQQRRGVTDATQLFTPRILVWDLGGVADRLYEHPRSSIAPVSFDSMARH